MKTLNPRLRLFRTFVNLKMKVRFRHGFAMPSSNKEEDALARHERKLLDVTLDMHPRLSG